MTGARVLRDEMYSDCDCACDSACALEIGEEVHRLYGIMHLLRVQVIKIQYVVG